MFLTLLCVAMISVPPYDGQILKPLSLDYASFHRPVIRAIGKVVSAPVRLFINHRQRVHDRRESRRNE